MIVIGDSETRLQLLAPLTPESTIARFLSRSGPGVQQVAYRVTSMAEAMDAVRRQGLRLLYEEPRRGTAGSLVNFIHPKDAGGVLVELVEPARSRDEAAR
jgi:methylmalonyl-CoA/ethylmalonyl-CoA epimerase